MISCLKSSEGLRRAFKFENDEDEISRALQKCYKFTGKYLIGDWEKFGSKRGKGDVCENGRVSTLLIKHLEDGSARRLRLNKTKDIGVQWSL